MKNTGKPYEVLTEQVFAKLLTQESFCAKLERNITLEGRSTKHQIDVTFEFVAGSVTYRTIIQCKDWGSAVKQEQVLAFNSVLVDIPGQPRGIMVSRSGFQKGARDVAKHHGIKLYELREPKDEDWEGLIRFIEIEMILRVPHFDNVRLVFDEDTILQEIQARGLPGFSINIGGHPSQFPMTYESGAICEVNTILNGLVPQYGSSPVMVRYDFTERVFVEISEGPLRKIPVLAIEAMVSVTESTETNRLNLDHLVAYCFRDVLSNSVKFLGTDGGALQQTEIDANTESSDS